MNWSELLKSEVEDAHKATEKLMELVDENKLNWKPSDGHNWMTTAQLLKHIDDSCGFCFRGFVTGDWGLPEGVQASDMKPEDMLPPAEKMPAVASLAEAKKLLAADKKIALEMLAKVGEKDLVEKMTTAPWDPTPVALGHRLLQMVGHLQLHKAQLFYYLKLQGKPVHTGHMFGM
ncbi:MAG: DinB family protein [Candidatus Eisenbacteria bacterium]